MSCQGCIQTVRCQSCIQTVRCQVCIQALEMNSDNTRHVQGIQALIHFNTKNHVLIWFIFRCMHKGDCYMQGDRCRHEKRGIQKLWTAQIKWKIWQHVDLKHLLVDRLIGIRTRILTGQNFARAWNAQWAYLLLMMQSALGTQSTKTSLWPRRSCAHLSPQGSDRGAIDSNGKAHGDAAWVSETGCPIICSHGRGVGGSVGDRRSEDGHCQW